MSFNYDALVDRQYGIFTCEEQKKIKDAKIAIIGCGGIGGTVATILARSGVYNLILVDPDLYEPTDANRQIGCFTDTIGMPKVEALKREILRISPEMRIKTYAKFLSQKELEEVIGKCDVAVAAADDRAYSCIVVRTAQKLGKFSVIAYPAGFHSDIILFSPDGPLAEDLYGIPTHLSYEEIKQLATRPDLRCVDRRFVSQGKWSVSWFREWMKGERTLSQLCGNVWLTSSLACLEILKLIAGKWKTIRAPYYWSIRIADGSMKVQKFSLWRKCYIRFCLWLFGIKWMGLGRRVHDMALGMAEWWLSEREKGKKHIFLEFLDPMV